MLGLPSCSSQGCSTTHCDEWLWFLRCTLYEIQPVIDFPLHTRGMTVWRWSVCFSLFLSPSTGNFHVLNGGIDSGSVLFVLGLSLSSEEKTGTCTSFISVAWGNVFSCSNLTCYFHKDASYTFEFHSSLLIHCKHKYYPFLMFLCVKHCCYLGDGGYIHT